MSIERAAEALHGYSTKASGQLAKPWSETSEPVRETWRTAARVVIANYDAEAEQWRHIATAPKDGTRVLLFLCTRGSIRRGYPEICWWGEHKYFGQQWLRHDGREIVGPGVATHWQPLPAPPPQS